MAPLTHISDKVKLNNGKEMPWLGLGVYKANDGQEVERAIEIALSHGYRLIDTASLYGNEKGVGRAVRNSGLKREQIFVTTKVWNSDQGYDATLRAFEASRDKLELDVVDLYLVHWPVRGKYKETYRALEKLYKEGSVHAIGVSNFQVHHLQDLLASCEIKPSINQVEFHPLLNQAELRTYCKQEMIYLQAWSPLMKGQLNLPALEALAAKYGKTPAQIVLRWDLQHGVLTIPKSVSAMRISENAQLFDFALSDSDMEMIDAINRHHRFGADPDHFE